MSLESPSRESIAVAAMQALIVESRFRLLKTGEDQKVPVGDAQEVVAAVIASEAVLYANEMIRAFVEVQP